MAREGSKAIYNKKGERQGVAYKRINNAEPAKTTYGVAVDNMGSPYRGAMDREINTPLGSIGYGYDGDTVYGNVTPAFYAGRYNGNDESQAWAGYNDYDVRAGRYGNNGNPMYFASLNLPENVNIPNAYKAFNTPVGALEFGTNDGNPGVYADYQPNNYYLQALANLLMGK